MTQNSSGIARIVVAVGGTFAQMVRFARSASADVLLYLDVLSEVDGVVSAPGVLRLPLAAGQTLATLVDGKASPAIAKFLASRPAIDLTIGLAQLRFAGKLAVQQFIAGPEFERLLKGSVFDPILQKKNCTVSKVELVVCSSLSGGTGGPAGGPIAGAIAARFREYLGATVDVRLVRVGAMSFVGLGDRVYTNAAAGLAEDVEFVTSESKHDRELRSLVLVELPPVGSDKSRRDEFAVQFAQAVNAPQVRGVLDRLAPNVGASSRFGSVAIVESGWYQAISQTAVARDAARVYSAELRAVLAGPPAATFIQDIGVDLRSSAVDGSSSVDQLLDEAHGAGGEEPPGLFASWSAATRRVVQARVPVTVQGGRTLDAMTEWRSLFADRCRTLADYRRRAAELRSLAEALAGAVRSRRAALDKARGDAATSARRLQAVRAEFFPRSVWGSARKILRSPKARGASFKAVVANARKIADRIVDLEAELGALEGVARDVSEELAAESRRVQAMLRLLARVAGAVGPGDQAVEVAPVDGILEDLAAWAAAPPADPEAVVAALAACVSCVTLSGLAKITEAREATIDAIAERIARGAPKTPGPLWAGEPSLAPRTTIVVLPPLAGQREELVGRVIELAGQGEAFHVVSAETAEGGANVLRLEIRHPRTLQEIFPRFLERHLEDAEREPELNFGIDHGPPDLASLNGKDAGSFRLQTAK